MADAEMRQDEIHGLLPPRTVGESTVYALDRTNPWMLDVLHARRRRRAWATLLAAVVFSIAVLMIFKSQASALEALSGGLVGGLPAPWPSPVGALVLGAVLVLVQSVAEEAFFRGWLQPVLCASWGAWAGLLLTAAAFALLHIIAGAHGVLAVVNLFLGGLLFGLLAL